MDDYVNSNADKLKGLKLNQRHFQGTKLLLSFLSNNVIPNSEVFFKNNFLTLEEKRIKKFKSFNYFLLLVLYLLNKNIKYVISI